MSLFHEAERSEFSSITTVRSMAIPTVLWAATLCISAVDAFADIHVVNLTDKKIYVSSAVWFEPSAAPADTSGLQVHQGRAGFDVIVGRHLEPKSALTFPDGSYLMIENADFRIIDQWNRPPHNRGAFFVHPSRAVRYRTMGTSDRPDASTLDRPELLRELVRKPFDRHHPGILRIDGRNSSALKTVSRRVMFSSRNDRSWVRKEQFYKVPGKIIALDFRATKIKHNGEFNVYLQPQNNRVVAFADLLARKSRAGLNFGKTETAEFSGDLTIHYIEDPQSILLRQ